MSFKLGTNRGNYANRGEIKTKMRFGKKAGDKGSIPGTPIIRVPLEENVMGEANMDGSIFVNKNITPGSLEDRQVKLGKLAYTDDSVTYNGKTFPRKQINGKDMIKIDGKWKVAGHTGFPWEKDANNGNY